MQYIKQAELEALLKKVQAARDYDQPYWIKDVSQVPRVVTKLNEESYQRAFDRSSFPIYESDYMYQNTIYEDVTSHRLSLQKLLENNGYHAIFLPQDFVESIDPISTANCNRFNHNTLMQQFPTDYKTEIQQCLNSGKLDRDFFDTMLTEYTDAELLAICADPRILYGYKELIFSAKPEVCKAEIRQSMCSGVLKKSVFSHILNVYGDAELVSICADAAIKYDYKELIFLVKPEICRSEIEQNLRSSQLNITIFKQLLNFFNNDQLKNYYQDSTIPKKYREAIFEFKPETVDPERHRENVNQERLKIEARNKRSADEALEKRNRETKKLRYDELLESYGVISSNNLTKDQNRWNTLAARRKAFIEAEGDIKNIPSFGNMWNKDDEKSYKRLSRELKLKESNFPLKAAATGQSSNPVPRP